jgi:Zn-dependent protease with chaperone function
VLQEYVSGASPKVSQQPSLTVWDDLRMGSAPDRLPGRRAGIPAVVLTVLWYAALTAAILRLTWDEVGPETFGAVVLVLTSAFGLLAWTLPRRTIARQLAQAGLVLDPPDEVVAPLAHRGIAVEIRVQSDRQVRDRCYRSGSTAWIVLAPRTIRQPQQLAFVLAHEVAHLLRNDGARQRVFPAIGLGLLVGAYITFDLRACVIAFCGVIGHLVAVRWWTELACDAFAVRWTGAATLRAWVADQRVLRRQPQNRGWHRRLRRTRNFLTHPPLWLRQALHGGKAQ